MADGSIIIDIILDDGSVVKGVADIDKQLGGIKGSGEKAALGIGKIVTALGLVALGAGAIKLVKDSIQGAFKRIDTFERFERVMNTVTGSVEETKKALDKTSDIVTGTAYTLDGAAASVQNFVTRGMSVDKATKYVEAFGDAVAFYGDGSQAQFDNVNDALSKMVTKGTVGMDQLNRLFDAGIDAVGMYAQATGRSAADVQKDLSSGAISAEDFMDTVSTAMMEGTNGVVNIAGAAKDAGASWGSTFGNMKTAVARGVANIIGKIDEMLTQNGLPDMRAMIAEFGKQFENVLKKIAEGIPAVVDWIIQVKNVLEPWIPLITNVALVIGSLVLAIGTANSIIKVVTGSMKLLNLAFSTTPVGAIIAGILLIVGAFIYLWKTNEDFRIFFIATWNKIKDIAVSVWNAISKFMKPIVNDIVKFVMEVWRKLVAFWKENGTQIKSIIKTAFDYIKNYITMVLGIIKGVFQAVWPIISGVVKIAWGLIKTAVKNGIDLVVGIIRTVLAILRGDWKGAWNSIKDTVKNIWNNIKDFFKSVNLKQIGKDIIKGLITGISSMAGAVKDAVSKVVSGIKDKITSALKIKSPSRWMRDMIGKNMMDGWKDGIEKEADAPKVAMDKATSGLLKSIKTDAINLTRSMAPNTMTYGSSSSTTNNSSKSYNPTFNNYFTRDESTPSEAARKERQQSQRQAMEWGIV